MTTILHLIDTTGPGGAETVFTNLLKELEQTEFRNVVVLRGEGWVAEKVRSLGITPHMIDSKGSFNLGYVKALRQLIIGERVDLIHAHLLGSNVYGALLALICGKPMIATFHGAVDVASGERFLRAKFFLIGRGASTIVCVSKRLQQELAERSPLPAHKLQLIYNGVDPEAFSGARASGLKEELGLPQDATVVISIGNIRPAKGYEYLVDAAVTMAAQDPKVHFVVVGHQKAQLFNKLMDQIARATTQPNIHWLGFRQDVASILRQADIFLLPSVSEGFSISTVEAMMAGVPIIATRSGGPEEIIIDGASGRLVPVRDAEAIVTAISGMMEPEMRKGMIVEAERTAKDRFSLQSMLANYKEIYCQLVN
ncbi:glycosyltransferase [Marinobacter halophilus]|uniref:Glycosyltransferase family 1 protein n=1 Tax=Marinobacter halophilus TaxID=1323740 RepID=A0A2T1K8K6_9GAMM|nr:glycosyltransferase [Marinobacter halophilus]PSF06481.1 glycosyltransferase family 1 protein [Marinobacter halophilus]GGC72965.1 glycosyl transferase family 1 [Marinobacter halophilus]